MLLGGGKLLWGEKLLWGGNVALWSGICSVEWNLLCGVEFALGNAMLFWGCNVALLLWGESYTERVDKCCIHQLLFLFVEFFVVG